jgi:signal transduction histidine kinase
VERRLIAYSKDGLLPDTLMPALVEEGASRIAGWLPRAFGLRGYNDMGIHLDAKFLSLVVHDLRTPLNVIGLTLRLIDQGLPKDDPDLQEDISVLQENVVQIERMLGHLTDFCRLLDDSVGLRTEPFDPRRMLNDLIQERNERRAPTASRVELDVRPGLPEEVELDQAWARLAVQYALANATAAADGTPVRVSVGGSRDRLVIECGVNRSPPPSVHSTRLSPDSYERLFGSVHERRGLDLAIAARVSELFGGSARLDVFEGRGTSVVLDWPARLETTVATGREV